MALKDFRDRFSKDKRASELLRPNPTTSWLEPKYKGPRLDPTLPGVGTIPSQVTPIESLLGGTGIRSTGPINFAPTVPAMVTPMPAPGNVPNPAAFQIPQMNPPPPDLYSPDAYYQNVGPRY